MIPALFALHAQSAFKGKYNIFRSISESLKYIKDKMLRDIVKLVDKQYINIIYFS